MTTKGYHHTQEAKERISAANIERKQWLRLHTPEVRAKIKETTRLRYGDNPPFNSKGSRLRKAESLRHYWRQNPERKQKSREQFINDVIKTGKHNNGLPVNFTLSKESRNKISKTVSTYYINHPDFKDFLRIKRLTQILPRQDTSIEIKMQNMLKADGIRFVKQFALRFEKFGTQLDIAIPELQIAIYCDGDYWHNLPTYKARDKKTNEILAQNGWSVLRFWEHEINRDLNLCKNKIAEVVALKSL